MQAAARDAFGKTVPVQFRIDPPLFQELRAEQAAAERAAGTTGPAPPPVVPAQPKPEPKYAAGPPPTLFDASKATPAKTPRTPRRWRTLGEFVVGPCNRVAHAAAQSVVEEPGGGPSPLVLHGPVGTGKTHLLEGIYVGLRKAHPDWRVAYVTAEDFTNRFVQAMRLDKHRRRSASSSASATRCCSTTCTSSRRRRRRRRSSCTPSTRCWPTAGRSSLTCDCHPRLADDFTPELADRLLGGAVWGLAPPDADTRLAILPREGGEGRRVPIPEDVLKFLAEQLRGNVRELEGALNSLRHYGRVTGRPIDVPLAREALGDLLRHAVRVVHLADVDAAVCGVLRLPPGTLQSKSAGLGGQPPADAGRCSWPQAHGRDLRRDRPALRRPQPQHGRRRREAGPRLADEERHADPPRAPWRVRELIELAERHLGR